MSELFLVNIKHDNICYEKLNSLANELTSVALKNSIGVHFNEFGDCIGLIRKKQMKNYFFISDSFLHCNASFLDILATSNFDYKNKFYNNLSFVLEIIDILEKHAIYEIEIYISSDGILDDENDIIVLNSDKYDVLDKLYQSVIDNVSEFAYEFPTTKINISITSDQ